MTLTIQAGRLVAVVVFVASAACSTDRSSESDPPERRLSVARSLGGVADPRFVRALEPRPLSFPADHGPHPGFRTEWWYLTGNVATTAGRHFGYQATFFRSALSPVAQHRESEWATRQLYMAHFAVTDTAGERFYSSERFGRGALGLAGADSDPLRVWLEDWEIAADGPADSGLPPLRLRLGTPEAGIDLRLETAKPVVLHGERGLSRKGPSPGNASFYYSYTRLDTRGTLRIGANELEVEGSSWMDHEWSTSVLEEGTVGWDWLSLQLEDGSELMAFVLRRADGGRGYESGTLVRPDGSSRTLAPGEIDLTPRGRWTSPDTGVVYPASWSLALRAEGLVLEIEPRLAAQELAHTFSYWEGAVVVKGSRGATPIAGAGYVELTGYGPAGALRGGTQG